MYKNRTKRGLRAEPLARSADEIKSELDLQLGRALNCPMDVVRG